MFSATIYHRVIPLIRPLHMYKSIRHFCSSGEAIASQHLSSLSSLDKKVNAIRDHIPLASTQQEVEVAPKKSAERLLADQVIAIQRRPEKSWSEQDYDILTKAEKIFATMIKGSRSYNEWQKSVADWIERDRKKQ
jgi:hypothetical protein